MAVPKRKSSRARRGMRRAHKHLVAPALAVCPKCRTPKMPHRVCPSCGTYRGKVFLATEEEEF